MKKTTRKKTTPRLTPKRKLAKFRALLVRACNTHLKQGGRIADGNFYDREQLEMVNCCPIQCAVGPEVRGQYDLALSKKLQFEFFSDQMWLFIDGFDNNDYLDEEDKNTPEYKLGQELRAKYIGE